KYGAPLVGYFTLATIGELLLAPIGLALISIVAPRAAAVTHDGAVVCHDAAGRHPRWLARGLLEHDRKGAVLPDDRNRRGARGWRAVGDEREVAPSLCSSAVRRLNHYSNRRDPPRSPETCATYWREALRLRNPAESGSFESCQRGGMSGGSTMT